MIYSRVALQKLGSGCVRKTWKALRCAEAITSRLLEGRNGVVVSVEAVEGLAVRPGGPRGRWAWRVALRAVACARSHSYVSGSRVARIRCTN